MKGLGSARRAPSSAETTKRKLVRVLLRPVQEGAAVRAVSVGIVQPAGGAFTRDAVANDVSHVGPCGAQIASSNAGVPCLDDDPPRARCHEACSGPHAGTHAAFGDGRGDVATLPQRPGPMLAGLPEHERRVTLGTRSPGIADPSQLRIEVVLSHSTSLDLGCWRDEIWRTRWNSRRCQTACGSQT